MVKYLYRIQLWSYWFQKAKKKPMDKKKPGDYGVEISSSHKILSVEDPPVRQAGSKLESVGELVTKLKDQGLLTA